MLASLYYSLNDFLFFPLLLFQESTPHFIKPEPKVSPEKIREFTYLKTSKKKSKPLSVATGDSGTEKSPLKFRFNEFYSV